MFNFFKKEEIPEITFWTKSPGLEKVVPIKNSKDVVPDWWIKSQMFTSNSELDKGTARHCPSFPELFRTGYILPLWCDIYVKIDEKGAEWRTPDQRFSISHHPHSQFIDYLPEQKRKESTMVLKLMCPWRLKTSPGYSILQLPVFYNYEFSDLFETLTGVIWTDIHHEINPQLLFKKYGEFVIPRGTPIATYIPYKREKFNFKCVAETPELKEADDLSLTHFFTKFIRGYKLHQQEVRKEKNDSEKNKSKCPFGFKK
jgi:hypothetical protein